MHMMRQALPEQIATMIGAVDGGDGFGLDLEDYLHGACCGRMLTASAAVFVDVYTPYF